MYGYVSLQFRHVSRPKIQFALLPTTSQTFTEIFWVSACLLKCWKIELIWIYHIPFVIPVSSTSYHLHYWNSWYDQVYLYHRRRRYPGPTSQLALMQGQVFVQQTRQLRPKSGSPQKDRSISEPRKKKTRGKEPVWSRGVFHEPVQHFMGGNLECLECHSGQFPPQRSFLVYQI